MKTEEAQASREQEALEALRHYLETGKEVADWLDTWGTEQEVDAPECHK